MKKGCLCDGQIKVYGSDQSYQKKADLLDEISPGLCFFPDRSRVEVIRIEAR